MKSGIDTVLDLINFDDIIDGADLVVTGEGRTDWQSCFGKVMQGVGDRCKAKTFLSPLSAADWDGAMTESMTTVSIPS
jgi:glycerate kinase